MVKVLCLGEIVGKGGVFTVKSLLKNIIEKEKVDFVIANGEGTTNGFGLGKNHSIYLHKLGIDLLTLGEKGFFKKDMVSHIAKASFVIRPANYPPGTPGRGWKILEKNEKRIAVINLLGLSGFNRVHLSNPYTYLPEILKRLPEDLDAVIVDFHATTTAEKWTMFYACDGKISAAYGTHSKALSADEQILRNGTGVICDTGRCGSIASIGGLAPDIELRKFLTAIPERSNDAWEGLELQGVIFGIENRKTVELKRIREVCKEAAHDGNS